MIVGLTALIKGMVPAGGLQASAICYDGRVTVPGKEKQDAITILLEHANGECVTIYLPYAKKFLRGYQYGDVIGTAAEKKIFI